MRRQVVFIDEETLTAEEIAMMLCGETGETEADFDEETKE